MFDWLVTTQKWLYGGMAQTMRSSTDPGGLASLVAFAFVFGLLHALMPGHGKSVLVSYHLGRPGKLIEGVVTGALLALTHVGSAVVLVLAGVAVISRSFAAGGRAPAFETMSAVLITLIGAYLVARALRSVDHTHKHQQDGRALAFVTGLIPCPLTTLILTVALARHQLVVGLVAVAAMLAGIATTLVVLAVTAVAARGQFMSFFDRTEAVRQRLGFGLELAAALAVLGLGIAMLCDRLK